MPGRNYTYNINIIKKKVHPEIFENSGEPIYKYIFMKTCNIIYQYSDVYTRNGHKRQLGGEIQSESSKWK